ncbi:Hypothetical protein P9303_27101 [Prochlorococcus marinus str. MIT 9303]|uniref:Uncharacterized protein n=1 Tax=Prochlorococcus marinus (strain MIT 9303) TaxID=59922 RepID=A2CD80_PROM3|nr:Hypothetical protein P9303_27101 [Prochlorococcus marinus str. MIT 9303]
MDFDEIINIYKLAGFVTVSSKGGDESGEHDDTSIEEELGDLADAANVLLSI